MHVDPDAFEKPCLLERAPAAKHGVSNDGVLLLEEVSVERPCQYLFLDESERAEAALGEEAVFGYPELKSQRCIQGMLARRRQGIAGSTPMPPARRMD